MTKNAHEIFVNYSGGSLDLRGCDLTGITLPQTVGGQIYEN